MPVQSSVYRLKFWNVIVNNIITHLFSRQLNNHYLYQKSVSASFPNCMYIFSRLVVFGMPLPSKQKMFISNCDINPVQIICSITSLRSQEEHSFW